MILMIGAGPMAQEYAKVLKGLKRDFAVVGRSKSSALKFKEATGISPFVGGLNEFCETEELKPYKCGIVTTGVEHLASTTIKLIDHGIKSILVEKPAGLNVQEIAEIADYAKKNDADVYVAYNRRFFSSVLEAQKRIVEEGGVVSFNFELTEWAHVIEKLDKSEEALNNWFLANSTHIADLAYYLGGKPSEIVSFVEGRLNWHEAGSVFSGAGRTESGALFNYSANWESAGRWSVEMLTKNSRYIFRPLEKLHIQERGSITINEIEIDDTYDKKFKPGLYKQVEAFLSDNHLNLCHIEEQLEMFPIYIGMAGYK